MAPDFPLGLPMVRGLFYYDTIMETRIIYTVNPDGSDEKNLTNSPEINDVQPIWSPDGSKIAFLSASEETYDFHVFVMNADGTDMINVSNLGVFKDQQACSPDGSHLGFHIKLEGVLILVVTR